MHNLQQNRNNESHSNTLQRKEHATHLVAGENPMATPKHPLARDNAGNDTRMQQHHPTTGMNEMKQPTETMKNDTPRSDLALPNPPIRIGILDLGPKVRKNNTGKTPH